MSLELNATIIHRKEISHGLLILRVAPDFELAPFKAGQYAVVGLPPTAPRVPYADPEKEEDKPKPDKLIRRAYSIASSSQEENFLEFYVALVHSGALTPRLFALNEGDRVFLGKKIVGMFTLEDAPTNKDVLFVATGTGLAPYVSMLRSAYKFETRKTLVIHAARVSWDLGYRNLMVALDVRWENFRYLPIIDEIERDPQWPGEVGFADHYFENGMVERILQRPVDPDHLSVFLCGNPIMVTNMQERLGKLGFTKHTRKQPGQIYVEEYWKD